MNRSHSTLSTILRLALPAIAQQALVSLLQYVDSAMVGHMEEAATAAVNTIPRHISQSSAVFSYQPHSSSARKR